MADINSVITRVKELDTLASKDWVSRGDDIHAPDDVDAPRGFDPSNYVAWNVKNPNDRAFIVESRTLMPQLVVEIERLQEKSIPQFKWKSLHGFRCQHCNNEGKDKSWEIEIAETKIGRRYICKICGAGGMMNDHDAPISIKTPEWKPIPVLAQLTVSEPPVKSIKSLVRYIAIRSDNHHPGLGMISWNRKERRWIWTDDENGEIPSWASHFRFTDDEGVPIPWEQE